MPVIIIVVVSVPMLAWRYQTRLGGTALCAPSDDGTARHLENMLADGMVQGEIQHLARYVKLAACDVSAAASPRN